jgi:hypothetical protein
MNFGCSTRLRVFCENHRRTLEGTSPPRKWLHGLHARGGPLGLLQGQHTEQHRRKHTNNADIIGPEGGKIDGPNGSKILCQAGAVSKPTEIKISVISHAVTATPETEVCSLEPHGMLFGGTVT